jgi:hypothetical protein
MLRRLCPDRSMDTFSPQRRPSRATLDAATQRCGRFEILPIEHDAFRRYLLRAERRR